VILSSYYIGVTEVTQALWQAVMGNNPSYYKGDNRPVESVSWNDCQEFIKKLNSLTGRTFRLPTEAEWEYAARGGNRSKGYKYSGSNKLSEVAWYTDNSRAITHQVAGKIPNELGLYDMSGNIWELCNDLWGASCRVVRGGGWINDARRCRVSHRGVTSSGSKNDLGLRLCLSPVR
jgi:formylglycine-generating enzyme required for sulfatase activity